MTVIKDADTGISMLVRKKFIVFIFYAAALFFTGCSTPVDIAGGGSDLPNGTTVAGIVYTSDLQPASNTEVLLTAMVLTETEDSVVEIQIDTTDDNGSFELKPATTGNFFLRARTLNGELMAFEQNLAVEPENNLRHNLVLHQTIELTGRLILPMGFSIYDSVSVFVPGLGQDRINPDDSGTYRLSHVPSGKIDIAFSLSGSINFTHITIDENDISDVRLWDIAFAPVGVMANAEYELYTNTFDKAYYVSPRDYSADKRPMHLDSVDTQRVNYYKYDSLDHELVEWNPDFQRTTQEYDLSAAGYLFSATATADTAYLVDPTLRDTLRLFGEILEHFPQQGEFVVAGLRIIPEEQGLEDVYNVVFMEQRQPHTESEGMMHSNNDR